MDDSQLNGDGSVADYIQNGGGSGSPYLDNQDAYSANDDGQLASNASSKLVNGTPVGTTGGSTSGLPSWFTNILTQAGNAAGTALTQTKTPLVNNKPSPSPAPISGKVAVGGMSSNMLMIIGAIIVAFFLFGKKR